MLRYGAKFRHRQEEVKLPELLIVHPSGGARSLAPYVERRGCASVAKQL